VHCDTAHDITRHSTAVANTAQPSPYIKTA
jgi:hypothetical protein